MKKSKVNWQPIPRWTQSMSRPRKRRDSERSGPNFQTKKPGRKRFLPIFSYLKP